MSDGRAITTMANIGALTDRMLVDDRALVKVPESMPPTLAAIVGCAVVTGLGAVFNVARVAPTDIVAVIGCGGVGLNVVQGARIAGASRVIAVDLSASKLDLARKLGATDAVDASQDDAVEAVRALVGEGVDHAFEVIGRPDTARQAFEMAAPGRRAYIVGVFPDDAELQIPALSLRRGKSLVGVFMGATRPTRRHPSVRRAVAARPARPRVDGLRRDRPRPGQRRVRGAQARRGRPRRRQLRPDRRSHPTVRAIDRGIVRQSRERGPEGGEGWNLGPENQVGVTSVGIVDLDRAASIGQRRVLSVGVDPDADVLHVVGLARVVADR